VSVSERIRIKDERVLSKSYGTLKSTTFDWRRNDGKWQTMTRDVFDRGNAAAILSYNLKRRTVILTRQFRLATYVNGYEDLLIEAVAGLLDNAAPEDRIRAEAEEEIGYRLHHVHRLFEAFMSPGAVTEKIHFFVAEYEPEMRVGAGGGLAGEGEDIEVLELAIESALAMVDDGRIVDAKTIILLQYAALNLFK
jgi:nudix-type nucleoside diphosphatase (YffH/AdpP family)